MSEKKDNEKVKDVNDDESKKSRTKTITSMKQYPFEHEPFS